MSDSIHVVCPGCNQVNRLPRERLSANGKCGSCQSVLLSKSPVHLTGVDFQKFIGRNDLPVLVDFWAPWCGPCKAIGPVVEELANEYAGKAVIAKMNVDDNPATPGKFSVRAIPTLILFKDGKVFDQVVGAVPKSQLEGLLKKAL